MVDYYYSDQPLISKLLVTSGHPYQKTCCYRTPITVKKNDIVDVACYGELTNDLGKKFKDRDFNVMLGWRTVLEDKAGTTLLELTKGKAYNITPMMHHGTFTDVGHMRVDKDYGDCFLAAYVWAAGYKSDGKQYITFERKCGSLSALVHR
jgi:hypothetical protein